MRWVLALVLICAAAGCSQPQAQPNPGEDVPRARAVQENVVPRGMPPATPPIPATSRSGQVPKPDGGLRILKPNPKPPSPRVPNAPSPNPLPP